MALTFIRAIIIFITLVLVMRLMGKRQIGEMQPFEFVITLIIADLACVPMADVSIPLIYGIVGVLTLFFMHQLVSLIERSGKAVKTVLSGKPSIVIDKNGVNLTELKKNDMGLEDLIESMRAMGYFALDDLDYAIFESNGKLSALEREKDGKGGGGLSVAVIKDGKADREGVMKIGATGQEISDYVAGEGVKIKDVEVMTVDGNGRVYFKSKNEKYRILKYPLAKGISW